MFFLISKTIGALFTPSNFFITIGVAGLILIFSRYLSLARKLLVVCVAGFAAIGFLPIGNLLLWPLATRFPAWEPTSGAPNGIVVLGGEIERLIDAAKLAHRYPKARVVYSGGNSNLIGTDDTEADVAESIFVGLGLSRDRLFLENQSRNTLENAEFSKAIAAPKPGEHWLLVTSAYHLPRSIGVFRQQGFAVEPYPIVGSRKQTWAEFLTLQSSFWERVATTDIAVREWMGLIAYRLAGRTSELLPSPNPKDPTGTP